MIVCNPLSCAGRVLHLTCFGNSHTCPVITASSRWSAAAHHPGITCRLDNPCVQLRSVASPATPWALLTYLTLLTHGHDDMCAAKASSGTDHGGFANGFTRRFFNGVWSVSKQ